MTFITTKLQDVHEDKNDYDDNDNSNDNHNNYNNENDKTTKERRRIFVRQNLFDASFTIRRLFLSECLW